MGILPLHVIIIGAGTHDGLQSLFPRLTYHRLDGTASGPRSQTGKTFTHSPPCMSKEVEVNDCMLQHGIKATVFEKRLESAYQSRPRDWGMTLHWGEAMIRKCLPPHLYENLDQGICCDPFHSDRDLYLPHFNAQTGEKLFETRGGEPKRVSRRKLGTFLSQGIDVEHGKSLSSIEQATDGGVVAKFEDGTLTTGSILIGCDGAHSAVRPLLVGAEAAELEDLDVQMFNVSCTFPKEIARLVRRDHAIFKNSYHPAGFVWWQSIQDVKNPNEPGEWLFQNLMSWRGRPHPTDLPDETSRLEFWREKAKSFADPWKSVGAHLPDDLRITVDRTTFWRPTDWSNSNLAGKVTLAGDAAHAMPPFRAQGLNNALEDAARLVEQMVAVRHGNKTLRDGIQAYEREMRERALVEIPVSVTQALTVHQFDDLMQAPLVKHGINKYREEQAANTWSVEVEAAEVTV